MVFCWVGSLPFFLDGVVFLAITLGSSGWIGATIWTRRTSKPARIYMVAFLIPVHDVAHALRTRPMLALFELDLLLCTHAYAAYLPRGKLYPVHTQHISPDGQFYKPYPVAHVKFL